MPNSDTELIQQVKAGNTEAYRPVVERYATGLINHLAYMVGDGDAAEDLAQEAFIRAYDKIDKYSPKYAFSTWLYKIADNLAYRYLKKAGRQVYSEQIIENVLDDKDGLEQAAEKSMQGEKVRRSVAALPESYKQVITLYYWEDKSYEEIAAILNKPLGTIRTWLFRAKQQLKEELHGQVG